MVKLYTTPTCPYCYTLKAFLEERGVKYEEIDVSQNEKAREEMVEKSGQAGVPVVDINGQIVVGFDRERIMELLDLKE